MTIGRTNFLHIPPLVTVVSVTGLPITPAVAAMRARGVLKRRPMFSEILEDGVRWEDGTVQRADVILWSTGFRSALDHLAPLMLCEPSGGITMTGRLATQVAKDPRVHLVGYGPSASTIGANRAGAAAARELMALLDYRDHRAVSPKQSRTTLNGRVRHRGWRIKHGNMRGCLSQSPHARNLPASPNSFRYELTPDNINYQE